ncbi:uncharacterized protein LOC111625657 [Centruroides sculpturatus]|uniref:uncharacterized protein LOC111625657 n=1 Tax=Centruroides sculpturatus TaxID=218467 RepID=UPI000C6D1374|nr:uncharacterized protein LOC111625657 [Centruroides sculpturatus]
MKSSLLMFFILSVTSLKFSEIGKIGIDFIDKIVVDLTDNIDVDLIDKIINELDKTLHNITSQLLKCLDPSMIPSLTCEGDTFINNVLNVKFSSLVDVTCLIKKFV